MSSTGTRGTGDCDGCALIADEGDRGPKGPVTVMAALTKGTGQPDLDIKWDQSGPEGTRGTSDCEAEINARVLMFSLAPEDATDSTKAAKIARYAERKRLAYNLTKDGALSLDGAGRKIHLKKGVVTLRNVLGLHALSERVMGEDASLQGQWCRADSVGDNCVLTKQQQQQQTNVVTPPNTKTMLHVRKMALVDPRLLKSLRENTTTLPQPPDPTSNAIDTTLPDLDV